MAKTKRRPKKKKQEAKEPDPKILPSVLNKFLQNKIQIKTVPNILMINDNFLWKKGDVMRYRINVWVQEKVEGYFSRKTYIGHSFFVHYHHKDKLIVDKTIEPKPEEEKVF